MRIGSQRALITIQRKVQVGVKKLNEPNAVWHDWREDVACEVTVRRGKEQFDQATKQRYSEEVWQFRTRYDEVIGLDNSMRVLHEDQIFDIKAVLPDAHRRSDCVIECTVQDSVVDRAPLSINITDVIEVGVVGDPYSLAISTVGGVAPYTFVMQSGVLPTGMSIDALTGAIGGSPTEDGDFPIVVKVTDDDGEIATLPEFTITVEIA